MVVCRGGDAKSISCRLSLPPTCSDASLRCRASVLSTLAPLAEISSPTSSWLRRLCLIVSFFERQTRTSAVPNPAEVVAGRGRSLIFNFRRFPKLDRDSLREFRHVSLSTLISLESPRTTKSTRGEDLLQNPSTKKRLLLLGSNQTSLLAHGELGKWTARPSSRWLLFRASREIAPRPIKRTSSDFRQSGCILDSREIRPESVLSLHLSETPWATAAALRGSSRRLEREHASSSLFCFVSLEQLHVSQLTLRSLLCSHWSSSLFVAISIGREPQSRL